MTAVGRNEPCPCGSGRKFKQCCLRAHEAEDSVRGLLRSAEGAVVPALFSYAAREFGREFFDEAWEEFFLWTDVPDDIERSREFGTTFDPFFVFAFVPDSAEDPLPEGWPTKPLAPHVLDHETDALPALHREFVEQACRSPASFFAVEAVVPGRALDIKDILTGRPFHVLEQSASRTLQAGDVLFTRVVTAGGGSIMIGTCPWVIPASWHIPIIDIRERLRPKRLLTREEVIDYDMEIREAYLAIADALLHPAPPVLQNTDGDPLELTALTYELGVTVAEAVERLSPLATLRGDLHLSDDERDDAGALVTATLTWIKAGNRAHADWDNTSLGTLHLEGARLVVEVNSARRRRRIEKAIAKYLGTAARLVDTTVTDVAAALENRLERRARAEVEAPTLVDPPQSPELQALRTELARRHWDAWFDTKIPALGNKTPRQAARTAAGRERLHALLADYSRTSAMAPDSLPPDIPALKRKLGLG